MKLFSSLVLVSALVSGCASNVKLEGHNVSNVDTSVKIDPSASIEVVPSKEGDTLTNKRYVVDVVEGLKKRGFTQVSDEMKQSDYKMTINFTAEDITKTQKVPVFNNERNVPDTICHRNPSTNARTCVTRYRHFIDPIVSGYDEVKKPTTLYTFQYKLFDRQGNLILDSSNTVMHESCSRWKMFEFLAKYSIARANFNDPVDKPYAVEMQENYTCE